MFFKTNLCNLLNVEYPLIQGAMAWIAGGNLAAAVSQAGGLGVIGASGAEPVWIKQEIDQVRKLTGKPFGVNLMLAAPGIEKVIELIIQEKVPVVTTGGGNPGPYMERLKAAGIKVIPVVASVALARRLSRLGADAIVAEGTESGGHVGEMTTMCLVPMVVDAVDVPVIAAGGIADGRGLIAALALGAQGVQMGTRFICAEECNVHPAYQQRVIKAKDRDTVICGQSSGHPVRVIRNQFTREYLKSEKMGAGQEELERLGKGRYPAAAVEGRIDEGSVLAGQICGLVREVQPAAEIVAGIISHACRIKNILGGIECQE
ncbi:MAG: enoyl-[acyl-carrier-protein] reductase FabK [Syntrophomonas sp.]|uniref:enoyl-[acyl-carrier-protein] reductase FabK n=1 Tax=Syntrophomonas sp. TaxID=2053627 RepID=UPI0026084AAF|nr:enoyl-[acyl-carrier-protein] reductase FabK [Syntrophomonas sp.]MDD2509826.1 enoyl-[acyl-carrier-protein] reductase FabK [Syntrophomonas sp.]MDD3878748.1 enoyl-[acyl-carrier-protein] reductase FabK [Syntrophomonas sp.]MDD4625614.1 enoyl-[acyl-carrier-protein] reductase FabK [Syntrophomonas sp.]